MSDYRDDLYGSYARDFKNSTGQFDQVAADEWEPCFDHYLRGWMPESKEVEIVDLGCGDGRLLYIFGRKGYRNVQGVDISQSQLEIARQVSKNLHHKGVIEFLEITEKQFDLIVSFDLIEHLDKQQVLLFLDLCYKKLSPGGRVILQTPNASSPFFGDVRYGDFTHEMAFTPRLLSQLLMRSGFMSTEAREASPVPTYSFSSRIRYWLWWGVRVIITLLDRIETGGASGVYTRVFLISGVKSDD